MLDFVTQWQCQQHPSCPVVSVVVAEAHLAELRLPVGPKGDFITLVVTDEAVECTIRGGLVAVAVSLDIIKKLQRKAATIAIV